MTKSTIRNKLFRRGYKLVTLKDAYGVPGYAVYDPSLSAFVFGGEQNLMTLEEIENWIPPLACSPVSTIIAGIVETDSPITIDLEDGEDHVLEFTVSRS